MYILKILISVGIRMFDLLGSYINTLIISKCCLCSQTETKHLILNVALKIKYSELTFKYKGTP